MKPDTHYKVMIPQIETLSALYLGSGDPLGYGFRDLLGKSADKQPLEQRITKGLGWQTGSHARGVGPVRSTDGWNAANM